MLLPYEKEKIKEGVYRIREEVPQATEDQMLRMLLYVIAKNGNPLSDTEQAEAKTLIAQHVRDFNRRLN